MPHHETDRLPLVVDVPPELPLVGVCFCELDEDDTLRQRRPPSRNHLPRQHMKEKDDASSHDRKP